MSGAATSVTDNPYWDAVKDHATPSQWPWDAGALEIGRMDLAAIEAIRDGGGYDTFGHRDKMVKLYSWTVTDPASIAFVAAQAPPQGLVDPMAGTGYWAYVLAQVGVSVVCYDIAPPEVADNPWHQDGSAWVPITPLDGAEAVAAHPDRGLLLAWPPYSNSVGDRVLRAYAGDLVIYIGEGDGGCTGDSNMHERLDTGWTQVAEHRPVQWWGLHDWISVYRRRVLGALARELDVEVFTR